MATELRELRRLVGDKMGDMVVLKATHASANATTFRDVVRLADRGDDAPSVLNRLLYFSDGTAANWGHEAAITGFTTATRTITFDPAATANPAVADEVELWATSERIAGGVGSIH